MDYRVFDKTVIVRMDPDEEVLTELKEVCDKENIKLAEVSALGALKEFSVGLYNTTEKKYYANEIKKPVEVTSLWGTVTAQNGEFYAHLHMSAADIDAREYGGHLQRAVVSATIEMVIRIIDGRVERKFDPETGLNLFEFLE